MITRSHPAFTLAELLISLTILGIIATFTITKVLQSQQDSKRISILKETISSIEAITYAGWQNGEYSSSNSGSYVLSKLNVVKLCSTNSSVQGCWTQANPAFEEIEPGAVLANGATLTGFTDGGPDNWIFVDWNGTTGPNVEGQDQIRLDLCTSTTGYCGASNEVRSGTDRVLNGYGASMTMYEEIFSK